MIVVTIGMNRLAFHLQFKRIWNNNEPISKVWKKIPIFSTLANFFHTDAVVGACAEGKQWRIFGGAFFAFLERG